MERALLLDAEADLARATGRPAAEPWAAAAAAWRATGRPYPEARARRNEAEARAGAGDRAGASAAAAAAHAIALRLGAPWLLTEVDGLVSRARLDPCAAAAGDAAADAQGAADRTRPASNDPAGRTARANDDAAGGRDAAGRRVAAGRSPAPSAPAPAAPVVDRFGLTPRERQVLALVASGATKREIGAALFMAEKTASVHVSRILAKLDVRSRTEAAAVAHRQGLDAG
ncbi:LuxR C-terminal-related transcriptional regulator [Patulibacter sp. NPDC049589]|uniref:helix-turn-helix transcriptional regulator n=1 Tax=Patulibacter sp. NPDC049589 TaxID=3154731 RepID=UPI00341DEBE7